MKCSKSQSGILKNRKKVSSKPNSNLSSSSSASSTNHSSKWTFERIIETLHRLQSIPKPRVKKAASVEPNLGYSSSNTFSNPSKSSSLDSNKKESNSNHLSPKSSSNASTLQNGHSVVENTEKRKNSKEPLSNNNLTTGLSSSSTKAKTTNGESSTTKSITNGSSNLSLESTSSSLSSKIDSIRIKKKRTESPAPSSSNSLRPPNTNTTSSSSSSSAPSRKLSKHSVLATEDSRDWSLIASAHKHLSTDLKKGNSLLGLMHSAACLVCHARVISCLTTSSVDEIKDYYHTQQTIINTCLQEAKEKGEYNLYSIISRLNLILQLHIHHLYRKYISELSSSSTNSATSTSSSSSKTNHINNDNKNENNNILSKNGNTSSISPMKKTIKQWSEWNKELDIIQELIREQLNFEKDSGPSMVAPISSTLGFYIPLEEACYNAEQLMNQFAFEKKVDFKFLRPSKY